MSELREPQLVENEIADLCRYLDAIPDELRTSTAFAGYRERLEALRRELQSAQAAGIEGRPTD